MDALTLGKLVIPMSRLAVVLGIAATLALAAWLARREPALKHWAGSAVLSGFVAGRIGYVLSHLDAYAEAPWTALYVWQGEFSLLWGLLGAAAYTGLRLGRNRTAVALALVSLGTGLAVWAGTLAAVQTFGGERPETIPALELSDLDGDTVDLQQFEGQPVVINLWATWCPPCRREMPVLERAAAENPEVAFVFANQAESDGSVREFLQSQGLELDNVLLDTDAAVAEHFEARALPTTLFFDADGELKHVHLGEVSRARLSDYLRETE